MDVNYGTDINGRAIIARQDPKLYNKSDKDALPDLKQNNGIWRGIDEKFIRKKTKSKIDLELKAYKEDIQLKRIRLKALYNREEQTLNELYQVEMHNKFISSQNQTVENVPNETSVNDEELLAKKKLQLDIAKCREIRPLIALRRDIETRRMQELQMKEKQNITMKKQEAEQHWHEIMIKDVKRRKELEESQKIKRLQKEREIKEILKSQIEFEKNIKEKQLILDKEIKQKLCKDVSNKIEESLSKEKYTKEQKKKLLNQNLIEQIEAKRKVIATMKQEEIKLENQLISLSIQRRDEEMRKKLAEKEQIRKEINLFNKHLSTVKSYRKFQENKDAVFVENEAKKQREEEAYNQQMFTQKRKELLQDALIGRNIQMEEKKKEENLAMAKASDEFKTVINIGNKVAEDDKLKKQNDLATKIAYRKDLENQMSATSSIKQNEIAQQKLEANAKLLEEQKMTERCVELMKREFKSENIHPFMNVVKKSITPNDFWHSFIPETKYTKY